MLELGYSSGHGREITHVYHCSVCGFHIGTWRFIDGEEWSDFEGWRYCPHCAEPLDDESRV